MVNGYGCSGAALVLLIANSQQLITTLLTTDVQLEGFGMRSDERLGIVDNEGEVATTAGTGHLPGEDVGDIAVASNRFGYIGI